MPAREPVRAAAPPGPLDQCRRLHHLVHERAQQVLAGRQVRAQVLALAGPHGIQLIESLAHDGLDGGRQRVGRVPAVGQPLTDGERLRQPQQVARRQAAVDDAIGPGLRQRRRQRLHERTVQLNVGHGRLAHLQRDAHLHPPTRETLLHQRAQARLEVGQRRGETQLQVEESMVDGPNGDADGGHLVVPGEGGKAGHALDHG
jgi:hypothetical protein